MSPNYHFSFDRCDWCNTRGKWSLARNPDRSWWRHHIGVWLISRLVWYIYGIKLLKLLYVEIFKISHFVFTYFHSLLISNDKTYVNKMKWEIIVINFWYYVPSYTFLIINVLKWYTVISCSWWQSMTYDSQNYIGRSSFLFVISFWRITTSDI